MFRKSILSTLPIAVLATAAAGTTSASAGGYGYNNGYGNGGNYGHVQQHHVAPRPDHIWQRHVNWCYERFDSYRSADNSYQPYRGPRAQCWSPFYKR